MVVLAQTNIGGQLTQTFGTVIDFLPKLLGFFLILIVGYFIAKILARIVDGVLERVGFDKAVERGGIKKALAKTQYDPSDFLAKIVLYAVMLFVLQLAFSVFGPNPISELIQAVIAFLPKLFVAILIVVIAAAIAAAVREVVSATLGGLSYGDMLANIASAIIIGVGIFAALNQIEIAPAIVNGLFYALLAIVAGSAIIAIGGSGIQPLRGYWEQALDRASQETEKIQQEAQGAEDAVKQRAEQRKQQARQSGDDGSTREPQDDGAAEEREDDGDTRSIPSEERAGSGSSDDGAGEYGRTQGVDPKTGGSR
ncbi:MAG: mechanosensitive ion channel family protein [Egibacteraceae bacterium]